MPKCSFCNGDMSEGAKFCAICGKETEDVSFCSSCKTELIPGKKFCHKCGAKVIEPEEKIENSENEIDAEEKENAEQKKIESCCLECNEIITPDKQFCFSCESKKEKEVIEDKHCPECGDIISKEEDICKSCKEEETLIIKLEEKMPEKIIQEYIEGPEKEVAITVEVEKETEEEISKQKCPKCSKEMMPGKKFCLFCGHKLIEEDIKIEPGELEQKKLCPECRDIISDNEKFCKVCKLEETIALKIEEVKETKIKEKIEEVIPPEAVEEIKLEKEIEKADKEEIAEVKEELEKEEEEMEEFKSQACIDDDKDIAEEETCKVVCEKIQVAPEIVEEEKETSGQVCSNCNKEIISSKNFCPFCGYKIDEEKTEETVEIIEENIEKQKLLELKKEIGDMSGSTISLDKYLKGKTEEKDAEEIELEDEKEDISDIAGSLDRPPEEEVNEEINEVEPENVEKVKLEATEEKKSSPVEQIFARRVLPALVIVCLIAAFAALFYKPQAKNNVAMASPTPAITEISEASFTPVVNSTPEDTAEGSPTPEIVSTEKPTELSVPQNTPPPTFTPPPTPVPPEPPAAVPTAVPTPAVAYNPPVYNYNYNYDQQDDYSSNTSPTAVPTEISYVEVKRVYCNEYIRNVIEPLYREKRYEEAIDECYHVISHEKNYYVNYLWMANCLLAYGALDEAKYYIDMAWKLEYNERGRIDYANSESSKLYDRYREMGGTE